MERNSNSPITGTEKRTLSTKRLCISKKHNNLQDILKESKYKNDKLINKFNQKLNRLMSKFKCNINSQKTSDILKFDLFDQALPKNILQLTHFSQYQSCQIIIHEKGKSFAFNNSFHKKIEQKILNIPVKEFNALTNLVKNSKNKEFDQTVLEDKNIEILGTFLAGFIPLQTHSILIIISKNDFFFANQDETKIFDHFIKKQKENFNLLIKKDGLEKSLTNLKQGLDNYPYPLTIFNEKFIPVFKNPCNNTSSEELIKNGQLFEILNKYKILFSNCDISAASTTTDILQYQKISLLGELLETLRHELNNPLFGLKLTTDLLQNNCKNKELSQLVKEISIYVTRCQNIMENFSKIYNAQETYIKIDLKKIINESLILAKSEIRAIKKEIIYENIHNDELVEIETNPTWLTQILFNLYINSSQALKKNNICKPRISIIIKKIIDTNSIEISISDNGPGIPKTLSSKIFTPFFTTKIQGTGLGLTICKSLIEKLDGNISYIENFNLQGATFRVTIPYNSIKEDKCENTQNINY